MSNMLVWDGQLSQDDLDTLKTTPFTHVKLFEEEPFEVYRCETDGGIVVESQQSLRQHAGHKMRQPVILTSDEVDLLVRKVIT